jgi:prolyl oligopeptidase
VQNHRTRTWLAARARPGLEARLREWMAVGVLGEPVRAGGRLFYRARRGKAQRPSLVWRRGDGREVTLVDPDAEDAEEPASLDWFFPSPDGARVAFGLSHGGDEESTLGVVEVGGRRLSDRIPDTRASTIAWDPDGEGFHYSASPPGGGLYGREIRHHRLGADPAEDPVVFGGDRVGRTAWPTPYRSPEGGPLLVHVTRGWTRSELYLVEGGSAVPRRIFGGLAARIEDSRWVDGAIVARTDHEAPRFRLVRIDPEAPEPRRWDTLVPEGGGVLEGWALGRRHLLLHHSFEGFSELTRVDRSGGNPQDVPLPVPGAVGRVVGDPQTADFVVDFSSYFHAPALLRVGGRTARATPLATVPAPLAPDDFQVIRGHYRSFDGMRIPLVLVHRRGIEPDGARPTLVTAYGGFGITPRPVFQRNLLPWLERGGLFVVAGVRGGGEYGDDWHRAGRREKKLHAVLDLEYALRHLIREDWTRPAHLAVQGRSNGALLVGALLTRAPHLMAAALADVGLFDMLRFHRFPPGELWIDEYGDPREARARSYLEAYSPIHQVLMGTRYPAVLLTTAAADSRVHWSHAARFAARLQAAQAGEAPVLFLRRSEQGHGAGKGYSQVVREYRDRYVFLLEALGGREERGP